MIYEKNKIKFYSKDINSGEKLYIYFDKYKIGSLFLNYEHKTYDLNLNTEMLNSETINHIIKEIDYYLDKIK